MSPRPILVNPTVPEVKEVLTEACAWVKAQGIILETGLSIRANPITGKVTHCCVLGAIWLKSGGDPFMMTIERAGHLLGLRSTEARQIANGFDGFGEAGSCEWSKLGESFAWGL